MTREIPAQSIGLIDPESASATVAHAFTMLPVINVFRAMANAETLYPPYIEYLSQLFKTLELDAALERMIVLRVSKKSDCFYAWRQNVVVARSVGVTEAQIASLENGDVRATCFTAEQQIAFALTDEVIERVEATDQTYTGLTSSRQAIPPSRERLRRLDATPRSPMMR
jgi:alkylhydroperoxidase family enzyme